MVLFGQLIRNTQKNSLTSAGVFFADSVLEREIAGAREYFSANYDPSSLGSGNILDAFPSSAYPKEGEGYISTSSDDVGNKTKYLYRVEATRVEGFAKTDPAQIWNVKVEVRWWQDSITGQAETRAGTGKISVVQEEIAYIFAENR